MKINRILFSMLLAGGLMAETASARWAKVASYNARGSAKEVKCHFGGVEAFRIECTSEEPVIINTVVLRNGGAKKSFTVARKLQKGQKALVKVDPKQTVTGLRISDDGNGNYNVFVDGRKKK
ncbi:MAG: hypothetical protein AAF492_23165 [Verrucomicrobiota bacterium]